MKVEIIGSGRLGLSLATLLKATANTVILTGRGPYTTAADVRLLTVPDASIKAVAHQLPKGPPILHCSGCLDESDLAPHDIRGTFHPLMTFPGPTIRLPDLRGVSATISGHPRAVQIATTLATDLGMNPVVFEGDRRLYHAAAVVAGNFSALMLVEGATILAKAGFDYDSAKAMLAPLAQASIQNALQTDIAMTGPASRGDSITISEHKAALSIEGLEQTKAVYTILSERISRRQSNKTD